MHTIGVRHFLLGTYLLVLGGGGYLTYVQQEQTLTRLETQIQAQDQPASALGDLKERRNALQKRVDDLDAEWKNSYKRIPETIRSPQVMRYLTSVAGDGFDTFDLRTVGRRSENDHQVFVLEADGKASFQRLYHFIWTLENHRPFYRIENLELSLLDERTTDRTTGRPRMDVLVSFQMEVNAIFGLSGEASGGGQGERSDDGEELPVARTDPHPPVPSHVLPPSRAGVNPFYPLIFDQIPPNEHGRLNIEQAKFLSIVNGEAVFETEDGLVRIGEGDRVYLGRIVTVDAEDGRVVARLNKGGIVGTVERSLQESGSEFGAREPR